MLTLAYYWRVLYKAARDTEAFLRDHLVVEAMIVVATFVAPVALADKGSFGEQLQDALVFPLIALGLIVGAAFLWNLARVPAIIDKRHREQIVQLQEALSPLERVSIAPQVDGKWVHLRVINDGPSGNFVAQVMEIDGMPDATVPWSIKWRGWDHEARIIAGGSAQLLDLAELVGSTVGKLDGGRHGRDLVRRYRFYSATTQGPVQFHTEGVAVRGIWDDEEDPASPYKSANEFPPLCEESDLHRLVSATVTVTSLGPTYGQTVRIYIGMTLDGEPILEVEALAPGEAGDGAERVAVGRA